MIGHRRRLLGLGRGLYAVAALLLPAVALAQSSNASDSHSVPADPAPSAQPPASMATFTIASGGSRMNGLVYLAAGPGPHPVVVFLHGYPGNEKNLDLAQAVRRAGYQAVYFDYRGIWGSGGIFSFAHGLEESIRQFDQRTDVQVDHVEFAVEIELPKITHRSKSGVVNQQVDFEFAFLRFFKQALRGVGPGKIDGKVFGANVITAPSFIAQHHQLFFSARDQQEIVPARGQLARERFANSRRGPGYECDVH